MKNLSSFLAWRYLRHKGKDKTISFMIRICFFGITIGTFALMLTLIIMNGFEKTIHEKMQGINAQIIISSPGNRLDYDELRNVLKEEFGPYLQGISGNSIQQALIKQDDNHSVLFLKGIDPSHEHKVSTIADKITFPLPVHPAQKTKLFEELLKDDSIIIGYKTAEEHGIRVGNRLALMIPEPGGKKKILLRKEKVKVTGIFNVGLEEYDHNLAFISLENLNKLFDEDGVDNITLTLKNQDQSFSGLFSQHQQMLSIPFFKAAIRLLGTKLYHLFFKQNQEAKLITAMKKRFPNLQIQSWMDLYPALVSSLKLEKYVMFFILALITLVACMNMISLLFMQIQQKRHDIAIFKAMGMTENVIQAIFLKLGLFLTLSGSACGLTLAAFFGFLLERYPFIKLPNVYYVSHLPARMDLEIFIVVFLATMLLGFLATYIPARRTKNITIAQVLRHE